MKTCEPVTTRRTPRRTSPPVSPQPAAAKRALVLVQDGRVVCVVEGHRHEAARSVAHLLSRLLMNQTHIYACTVEEAALLTADLPLSTVPQTWSELYRAVPCEDTVVGFR